MKEIYDWVPWFTELAQKIADGSPKYLAECAKKIRWSTEGETAPLLRYGDENIDPFSFLYFLASKNTTSNTATSVFSDVSKVFALKTHDWSHIQYFPTAVPFNALFHDKGKGNPNMLWKLFDDAVRGRSRVRGEDFEAALHIPKVALPKLTQTLFLANPHEFLPWDRWQKKLDIHNLPAKPTWDQYQKGIDIVRAAFPCCQPNDINIFSYLQGQKEPLVSGSSKFFQIASAPEYKGADHWADDFEPNNWVYTLRPSARLEEAPSSAGEAHESPYPLEEPKRGDIVLVRKGESTREVHAMGVVYENDYAKARSRNSRIHVLWMNKSTAKTFMNRENARFPTFGFSRVGHWTDVALNRVEEYAPTLRLLKKLGCEPGGGEVIPPPPRPVPPQVEHARNRVLYGPPGTGKTYGTVRHALAIIDGVGVQIAEHDAHRFRNLSFDPETGDGEIAMITFHQNFAYEDFVEGIRPTLNEEEGELRYELRRGLFRRMAKVAEDNPDKRFVLIIDEINRGNIAKIFGELITLLEDSRRLGQKDETRVTLPYSGEEFGVPDNLYVIGTMNTADRSIQLLDTALRRRFEFIEMMPVCDHDLVPADVEGVDCRKMLKAMNERIVILLDREHQIGHTYFRDVDGKNKLADTFQSKIFPLLQEYFFDDWSKIRAVLGGNGFVIQRDAQNTLHDTDLPDEGHTIYERLPSGDEKWCDPAEYRKIYESGERGAQEDS